jgi:glycosyltransferase involved in cell wall biosynthesis
MWRGKTVAVIFPTYNERDSIRAAMLEYFQTGLADQVIVVNNNAAPGTSEEIAGTGALEILMPVHPHIFPIRALAGLWDGHTRS